MKRLLFLVIITAILFNCAPLLQKKKLPSEDISLHEICKRIEQNYWKLSSIKGRAHLSIETPKLGFTAVSKIILESPDILFLKVKAGFGLGVGSIFIEKDSFIVHSSLENTVYYGTTNSFNLGKFINVNIEFKDLIGFFSGIPIISEKNNASLSIDDNKYLITSRKEKQIKKYWVDPTKFVITNFHLYNKKGEILIKQEFQRFQKEKGVYLPKIIKINHPKGKERVTLVYTNRETNSKIKQKDLQLRIPNNSKKVML